MKRHAALAALPLLLAVAGLAQEGPRVAPLPRAHAHNDYAHPRPLLDALACGFCSVEADINLIDGTLLVAHEPRTTKPERTLEALYLEPLAARAREYGGSVYPTEPGAEPMPFFLMIDIKTDPAATFAALLAALAPYRDMLTTYDADGAHPSAVTVLVCRPDPAQALATSPRLVAIDGNLADLDGGAPVDLIPQVSESWRGLFRWTGEGPMPEDELRVLRETVARAHEQGRRIRFWGLPRGEAVWRVLYDEGVDLLNLDDLERGRDFLLTAAAGA